MDEKNKHALLTVGVENLLEHFVNLPDTPGNPKPAREFAQRFGDLAATRVPLDRVPPSDYYRPVYAFRRVWEAKTYEEKKRASEFLSGVFSRHVLTRAIDRPELKVDLTADQVLSINPMSALLLDILAITLIRHQKELGTCERKGKGCSSPYFLKSHGRQRFCSRCADVARKEKKERWWSENRDRFIRKWRKQRLLKKKQSKAGRNARREK